MQPTSASAASTSRSSAPAPIKSMRAATSATRRWIDGWQWPRTLAPKPQWKSTCSLPSASYRYGPCARTNTYGKPSLRLGLMCPPGNTCSARRARDALSSIFERFARHGLDAGGVEAIVTIQMSRRRDEAVFIRDAVAHQPRGHAGIGQHLRDRAAESAERVVLLDGQDELAAARRREDRIAIDGLDRGHVDEPDRPASRAQRVNRGDRGMQHRTARDQGELVALAMHDRLAELERHVFRIDVRLLAAADAKVDRLRMVHRRLDRGGELRSVRRCDHGQVRDAA